MAQSVVTIQLTVTDDASGKINAIANLVENRLSNSFRNAGIQANLFTKLLESGANLVGNVFNQLGNSIKESISIQQSTLTSSGDLMKMIGLSFKDATGFIEEFSQSMARVAADLPGTTQDYVNLGKGITDNLVPAFKGLDGKVDLVAYKKSLEEITKSAGFRVATSEGVTTANASLGISKFLGGGSLASLNKLKFFQANPAVIAQLESEAKKLGKQINQLSARERSVVLEAALRVPDEIIKFSQKSVGGLLEGLKSSLIDPQIGLFGLMRDLDKKAGMQSAFTAIQDGLNDLIGQGGLFSTLGETLKSIGFEAIDPMVALRNIILSFNSKVRYFRDVLEGVTFIMGDDGLEGAGSNKKPSDKNSRLDKAGNQFVNDILYLFNGERFGKYINNMFTSLGKTLEGTDFNLVGAKFGEILAIGVNNLASFINTIDWLKLGGLVLKLGSGLLIGFSSFLINIDWIGFARAVGTLLLGATAIAGAALIAPVIAGYATIAAGVSVFIVSIATLLSKTKTDLTSGIAEFFSGFLSVFQILGETVSQLGSALVNTVTGFFSKIQGFFSSIKIPGFGEEPKKEVITDQFGLVPNAASGLPGMLSALLRESRQSPTGSRPVIANSSEAILTLDQQKALMANSGSGGLTINNLTINSAATNAKDIAKDIMNGLMAEYNLYKQSTVAGV